MARPSNVRCQATEEALPALSAEFAILVDFYKAFQAAFRRLEGLIDRAGQRVFGGILCSESPTVTALEEVTASLKTLTPGLQAAAVACRVAMTVLLSPTDPFFEMPSCAALAKLLPERLQLFSLDLPLLQLMSSTLGEDVQKCTRSFLDAMDEIHVIVEDKHTELTVVVEKYRPHRTNTSCEGIVEFLLACLCLPHPT